MLTYTQDFSPYATQTNPRADGDSKPEGKAAARRRRQMERQQRRQGAESRVERAAAALTQMGEQLVAAVEEAQAERLRERMERLLAPPPEKPKGITQAKLVEWFEKWRKPIRSWFRTRCSIPPGDIDDLSQEVFLRLLKYPTAEVDNPQGYIFRVASNVASEWRERSRNNKPHEADWLNDLIMDDEKQPERIVMRNMDTKAVQAVVDALPPRQRLCLLAHVNKGITYKQIAEEYGLTYRIVLRDLTKAYSALRAQLPPDLFH